MRCASFEIRCCTAPSDGECVISDQRLTIPSQNLRHGVGTCGSPGSQHSQKVLESNHKVRCRMRASTAHVLVHLPAVGRVQQGIIQSIHARTRRQATFVLVGEVSHSIRQSIGKEVVLGALVRQTELLPLVVCPHMAALPVNRGPVRAVVRSLQVPVGKTGLERTVENAIPRHAHLRGKSNLDPRIGDSHLLRVPAKGSSLAPERASTGFLVVDLVLIAPSHLRANADRCGTHIHNPLRIALSKHDELLQTHMLCTRALATRAHCRSARQNAEKRMAACQRGGQPHVLQGSQHTRT
mmetsp:Transcript_99371/g.160228  ORF Transcript_99371/g.160228 Transcript_99371/m.160228 type:complete len:296 (-) Transcript_99371:256-1143(-)